MSFYSLNQSCPREWEFRCEVLASQCRVLLRDYEPSDGTFSSTSSRPGGHKQKHRSKGYLPLPGGGTYDRVQKGGRNTLVSHSSHRTPSRQHNQNGQQKKKKSRGNQQRDGGGNRNNKFRRPKTLEGVSLNKAKKTDNEELPFYSLPDSIFDELPEYFRPEPRGLAALISFSRENTVKKLKWAVKSCFKLKRCHCWTNKLKRKLHFRSVSQSIK